MGLVCPNPDCGHATSLKSVTIKDDSAFLPKESTEHSAIFGPAHVSAITGYDELEYTRYGVFQCQECGHWFLAKENEYDNKGWVVVYPIPQKPIAKEIPEPLKSEFVEANLCFAVGAYRACSSMCQRAQESLCQDKKVSGLNQLLDNGIISSALFDRATEIRLWAGIVKHKPLTESVSKDDAEQLLDYLDMILNAVYVEPTRFEALKQKREQIQEKKSD